MAQVLNRQQIVEALPDLFRHAHAEIVMAVPYIKLNDFVIQLLDQARNRDVQVLIICREEKVDQGVINTLCGYKNITLLQHPNLHAKCYINESQAIIGSMNLHDYSMRENRELAVSLKRRDVNHSSFNSGGDWIAYDDTLEHIREIYTSARLTKSSEMVRDGYRFKILRRRRERLTAFLNTINKYSANKIFSIDDADETLVCRFFSDKFHAHIEPLEEEIDCLEEFCGIYRFELRPAIPLSQLENSFDSFSAHKNAEIRKYFKTYWNPNDPIKIYRDHKNYRSEWQGATLEKHVHHFIQAAYQFTREVEDNMKASR